MSLHVPPYAGYHSLTAATRVPARDAKLFQRIIDISYYLAEQLLPKSLPYASARSSFIPASFHDICGAGGAMAVPSSD
jgi:hypothetical protein